MTDNPLRYATDSADEDDDELRDKWASIVSAVDGDTIDGTVVDVRELGDELVIDVETRLGTLTERYEAPKPPLDDYPFTRVANAYGQGLVDIPALEGENVPCRYEDGEWSIHTPKPGIRTRIRDISLDTVLPSYAYHTCTLIGALIVAPLGIGAWWYKIQSTGRFLGVRWDGDVSDYTFFGLFAGAVLSGWLFSIVPLLHWVVTQ